MECYLGGADRLECYLGGAERRSVTRVVLTDSSVTSVVLRDGVLCDCHSGSDDTHPSLLQGTVNHSTSAAGTALTRHSM